MSYLKPKQMYVDEIFAFGLMILACALGLDIIINPELPLIYRIMISCFVLLVFAVTCILAIRIKNWIFQYG